MISLVTQSGAIVLEAVIGRCHIDHKRVGLVVDRYCVAVLGPVAAVNLFGRVPCAVIIGTQLLHTSSHAQRCDGKLEQLRDECEVCNYTHLL